MAKNYPYFKFMAAEWLTGNIAMEDYELQGLFINICALYWQRDGYLTTEDILKRYKLPDMINRLMGDYFTAKNGKICIKFLDAQLADARKNSRTRSKAASKSAKNKNQKNELENDENHNSLTDNTLEGSICYANASMSTANAHNIEERREEKKRVREDKSKRRKEINAPPSLHEFKIFFEENGFRPEVAERAWNGYESAAWNDTSGKPVLNWKQKCYNVWFTDENKIGAINFKNGNSPPEISKHDKFFSEMAEIGEKIINEHNQKLNRNGQPLELAQ